MGDLAGQAAIVTGAGTSCGAVIARALAAAGARVVVADRDVERAARLASEIGGDALEVDPCSDTSVGGLAYHAADLLDEVDILVNILDAACRPAMAAHPGAAGFDQTMTGNVEAISLMGRHFGPGMKARGRGTILNVIPSGDNARTDAMTAATQAMAADLSPHGVRVYALRLMGDDAPRLPRTRGFEVAVPMDADASALPRELGAAAAFLCTEAASIPTGRALHVDGARFT
ncbi:SDR family oxidoreductase [Salipiger sp. IMCC34102]|uniref:SDR family oxidoreductase n=1 Tax=Salipiger sp. IMCC34102 TaxID=2510647 RepID=UPI002103071C|nr:SDR family oxidoreductase [Salipiger sp. IMCC34102]